MTYTLYHGDCLAILPTLAAGSVDAVICDPPYGSTACSWDSVIPFNEYVEIGGRVMYADEFLNYKRHSSQAEYLEALDFWESEKKAGMWQCIKHVLKPRGACVMFGSEPFSSLLRVSNLEWYKYDWVWDKKLAGNFLNANRMPLMVHELIHVFMPDGINYNPQMTKGAAREKGRKQAMPGDGTSAYGKVAALQNFNDNYFPTSILQFSNGDRTNSDNGLHPTQKPVALLEYLVKTYTNPGDTVLDFTMGSCSTGKAAIKNGRHFIGIDDGYCEKENSEYYGWSWVQYAEMALANLAGDFTLTPAERDSGQLPLWGVT